MILLFLVLHSLVSQSQSVTFSFTDGSQDSYYLEGLDKFTFDGELMNVHLLSGTIYSWDLSLMDYYRYIEEGVVTGLNDAVASELTPLLIYPNPTSGELFFDYSLGTRQNVQLEITDQYGKSVYIAHTGIQNPGKQTFNWSGTDFRGYSVPSGIYFCRLLTSKMQVSKAFIIQR